MTRIKNPAYKVGAWVRWKRKRVAVPYICQVVGNYPNSERLAVMVHAHGGHQIVPFERYIHARNVIGAAQRPPWIL